MKYIEIKSCPHCGGVSYLRQSYSSWQRIYYTFVKCEICGAQGKAYQSRTEPAADEWSNSSCESAIEAWNMRYPGGNNDDE